MIRYHQNGEGYYQNSYLMIQAICETQLDMRELEPLTTSETYFIVLCLRTQFFIVTEFLRIMYIRYEIMYSRETNFPC